MKNYLQNFSRKQPSKHSCIVSILGLLLILSIGCKKEECEIPPQPVTVPSLAWSSLSNLPDKVATVEDQYVETIEAEVSGGGNELCYTDRRKWVDVTSENRLYGAFDGSIYPGSLIDLSPIGRGDLKSQYNVIAVPRKPVTISFSLTNSANQVRFPLEDVTTSGYREVLKDIQQQQLTGRTPAAISSETNRINAKEKIEVALRASHNSPIAKIEGAFDFTNEKVKSRLFTRFEQAYYSIDMDFPDAPDSLFMDPVDAYNEIKQFNYSPAYISSIIYGRYAALMIESESSYSDLTTALDASIRSAKINVEADQAYQNIIDESSIKVLVVGGDADPAINIITGGYEGFIEFLKEGSQYGPDSPGVPISYTLRYVADNSVAKIAFSSDYNTFSCSEQAATLVDTRELRAGKQPADSPEGFLDIVKEAEGFVLTGIGTEVRRERGDENIYTIKAEIRKLFPNGDMGPRKNLFWLNGDIKNDSEVTVEPKLETWQSARNNEVIVQYGADVDGRNMTSQFITTRKVRLINGRIELLDPETFFTGEEIETFDAICPDSTHSINPEKSVIVGIGMRASDEDLKTLILKMGELK